MKNDIEEKLEWVKPVLIAENVQEKTKNGTYTTASRPNEGTGAMTYLLSS